ncbi:MAG: hypothetical protein LBN06_08545 [Prevotellaceae bacterium]|nr:hypothetical protein [Prevotellaceae bacterium]
MMKKKDYLATEEESFPSAHEPYEPYLPTSEAERMNFPASAFEPHDIPPQVLEDIRISREEYARGEYYTQEEVHAMFEEWCKEWEN